MIVFSLVIVTVVATISFLVQHYVVQQTTATEMKNARLQRDQAIHMIEIAWQNHLYHRKTLLAERRNLLRDVTALAFGVLEKERKKYLSHEITEAEAKKRAMNTIRSMRFSHGAGYFWIQDCQKPIPYMLMHPVVPALDNKPCNAPVCYTALEDGSNLNAQFVSICEKSENKEAFLPYRWPKPTADGLTEIQPKLSFVKIYPEWGWLIGTGLYIDDIERESNKNLEMVKSKIIKNLSALRIGQSGYIFIFDKNLNFVSHPTRKGGDRGDQLRPDTGTSILEDLINQYNSGTGDFLEYRWPKPGESGEKLYQKIALISYFKPLGWYVCASIYKDELKIPAQELMAKILLAAAVLLACALVFAWLLSKSVSKPIEHLAGMAKKIEKGEVDTIELQHSSLIEIESLEKCLRDMLLSLNKANEQLRQSQKMEAIGQLAGGIAHDFNNMLGGILGCADLLQRKLPEDSPHRKYIEMINDSATRAAELASQLLTFSRKQVMSSSVVDIHRVIRDAVTILENTIDKRIVITSRLNAAQHQVSGEYAQLQNVFINLGINASHAMPDGGTLSFSTDIVRVKRDWESASGETAAAECDFIELVVSDTGVGMSAEILSRIFEPFFTTKKQEEGTGLGLASAYATIQQHGGTIRAESVEGEGSQFVILLPLTSADEPSSVPTDPDASELTVGTGTILVVDDEEVLRFTLEKILKSCGYNVLLAANGREAVAVYTEQKDKVDAVICDMMMPEMNGYDCFLKFKEINPAVKLIIASGFTGDTDIEELMEKGLDRFIKKPFTSTVVSRVVADVIRSRA